MFRVHNLHRLRDMEEEDPKEDLAQLPQSKIVFGGVFVAGSASNLS